MRSATTSSLFFPLSVTVFGFSTAYFFVFGCAHVGVCTCKRYLSIVGVTPPMYVHTYFTDSVLVSRVVFMLQRRDGMNWKKENKKGGRIIVVHTFSGASYCN